MRRQANDRRRDQLGRVMLTRVFDTQIGQQPTSSDMKKAKSEDKSFEHIPHTFSGLTPGSSAFNSGLMQQNNYEYVYSELPKLLAYMRLQEQQKQQSDKKWDRGERKTAPTPAWAKVLKLNLAADRIPSSHSNGGASTPMNRSIEENSNGESGYQSVSVSPAMTVNGVQKTTSGGRPASRQPHAPAPLPLNGEEYQVSKMDVLSEQIWHYHMSLTQSEALLNRKLQLRDLLYFAICPVFPLCGLYIVGSSLNGFGNNSSDMDLCLMITNKDLDQRTDAVVVLNMIMAALHGTAWIKEKHLIPAKVPILRIKFNAPFADITVDLNANNSVAIKNTHLLCYYSSFDWRVRPLVTAVKEWAKRRGINDANRSSFTSYSLVLMTIHYLQCGASPAVLPSLQKLYCKRFRQRADVRSLDVSVPLDPSPESVWSFDNKMTLGELLIGFFEYYAFKFDFDHDAISVRLGTRLDRAVVAKQRSPHNHLSQWRCVCIEEPFTFSNTAHSVYDEMVFDAIKQALVDGFNELDANRDLAAFIHGLPPISVLGTPTALIPPTTSPPPPTVSTPESTTITTASAVSKTPPSAVDKTTTPTKPVTVRFEPLPTNMLRPVGGIERSRSYSFSRTSTVSSNRMKTGPTKTAMTAASKMWPTSSYPAAMSKVRQRGGSGSTARSRSTSCSLAARSIIANSRPPAFTATWSLVKHTPQFWSVT